MVVVIATDLTVLRHRFLLRLRFKWLFYQFYLLLWYLSNICFLEPVIRLNIILLLLFAQFNKVAEFNNWPLLWLILLGGLDLSLQSLHVVPLVERFVARQTRKHEHIPEDFDQYLHIGIVKTDKVSLLCAVNRIFDCFVVLCSDCLLVVSRFEFQTPLKLLVREC